MSLATCLRRVRMPLHHIHLARVRIIVSFHVYVKKRVRSKGPDPLRVLVGFHKEVLLSHALHKEVLMKLPW